MKKLALAVAIVSLGAAALIATAVAENRGGDNGGRSFSAKLSGNEEIIPASGPRDQPLTTGEAGATSTIGSGLFSARIRENPLRIEYRLSYEDLEGANTLFAHIHFGQLHTVGGVSVFLCGDTSVPDPEPPNLIPDACPADSGTVDGTIVAEDVVGPTVQGIAAGELTELIRAIRNGVTYVNVHTSPGPPPNGTGWPSGEIRGQIDHGRDFGAFRGKDKDDD
jgi:CHRD domain